MFQCWNKFKELLNPNKNEKQNLTNIKQKLRYDLDKKKVLLIDYENIPYLPKRLYSTRESDLVCYIFFNKTQRKRLTEELKMIHPLTNIIQIQLEKSAKNFLDIGIGMYVGMINSLYDPECILIYSKDKGYHILTEMGNTIGITNIYNVEPEKTLPVEDNEIKRIINRCKKDKVAKFAISPKKFKKKLKFLFPKLQMDDINYVLSTSIENGWIQMIDLENQKLVRIK